MILIKAAFHSGHWTYSAYHMNVHRFCRKVLVPNGTVPWKNYSSDFESGPPTFKNKVICVPKLNTGNCWIFVDVHTLCLCNARFSF